jgi:hypothetical protein
VSAFASVAEMRKLIAVRLMVLPALCAALLMLNAPKGAARGHSPPSALPNPSPSSPAAAAPTQDSTSNPPRPQTEAEKRRLHVPYVRAATNCIATAIRGDEEFPLAATTDNFQPLIGRAIDVCKEPLSTMVQMHDVIYGGGGSEFFTGPYLLDLGRAVRQVLATDISLERSVAAKEESDRKAAEANALAAQLEAESKARAAQAEKIALLEKSRDLLRDKMFACLDREGASMVLTDEKAEVVAKAAMIFCQSDVDAVARSLMEIDEVENGSAANPQGAGDVVQKRVLEIVTAEIVKLRGAIIEKSLKQSSPSPDSSDAPHI